jgi:hypothetical protein
VKQFYQDLGFGACGSADIDDHRVLEVADHRPFRTRISVVAGQA